MSKRVKEVFEGKALPHELLHVVTLTQEVCLPLIESAIALTLSRRSFSS